MSLPREGLQQAKGYAEVLGINVAYATNGQSRAPAGRAEAVQTLVETAVLPAVIHLTVWSKLT